MANNRMQIYCKKCLELLNFMKYYPSNGWYFDNLTLEEFEDFVTLHNNRCFGRDEKIADKLTGERMFGFRMENDNDEFRLDYTTEPHKLKRR